MTRSSRTTVFKMGRRSSAPAPTRHRKSVCQRASEELSQLWRAACLPTAHCRFFLLRELIFTAAFLGNRAPHSVIDILSPYKMLHGTEPDVHLLCVIGVSAFVHIETHIEMHIETYSKSPELKAVEGRLAGHSNISKSYRTYNPATRCIMESRNVVVIETSSRLPPPLSARRRVARRETEQTTTTTF